MADINKEAITMVLSETKKKFAETVELSINLKDIDMGNVKNRIDIDVILPKGRGYNSKVAIFATGDLAMRSKNVADYVITPETMDEIFKDKRKSVKFIKNVNFFLAEAQLMPAIGKKLGIYLGPRNKMPRPLPSTADPAPIIANLRKTVKIRSRDKRTFHVPIGTVNMKSEEILDNIDSVLKAVVVKLENGYSNIGSIYIKKTMGKSYKVM